MLHPRSTGARLAWVLLMLLVTPAAAVAQTCSASQPGTFNLRTNQPVIAFNQPGVNDFEMGWIEFSQNVQVRVRPNFGGNNQWALCLRSEDPDLGGYGKAVSDVEFRLTGDANWRPLDTVDQLAATGQGNQNVRLRFRVSLSYLLDEPGSYGALLAFTAYQQ